MVVFLFVFYSVYSYLQDSIKSTAGVTVRSGERRDDGPIRPRDVTRYTTKMQYKQYDDKSELTVRQEVVVEYVHKKGKKFLKKKNRLKNAL